MHGDPEGLSPRTALLPLSLINSLVNVGTAVIYAQGSPTKSPCFCACH